MKLLYKIRLHPDSSGPRPKSRITEEDCGQRQLKTCLNGAQKHLSKSGGNFLLLMHHSDASIQYSELNGLIDLAQLLDHFLVILLVDICNYVSDRFVGLQVLPHNVDSVVG